MFYFYFVCIDNTSFASVSTTSVRPTTVANSGSYFTKGNITWNKTMWKVTQIVCLVISDVISIVTNINMRPSSYQRNFYAFYFIFKFWKNGQLKEVRNDVLFTEMKYKKQKKIKYDTNIINLMQKYFDNDNKKVIEPSIFKDS